jgi:PmbA protein
MTSIGDTARNALGALQAAGAKKAQVQVSFQERTELNVESGRISLLRTNIDQAVQCKVLSDQKLGLAVSNQITPQAIAELADEAMTTARGASPDPAHSLATDQGHHSFHNDTLQNDPNWMYESLSGFLETCRQEFPQTVLESTILQFVQQKDVLINTEGTHLESAQNRYDGGAVFLTKDGAKTSSSQYCGFVLKKDGTPLIEHSGLRELLRQSAEQTHLQKTPFVGLGDVIFTPHCFAGLVGDIFSYLQTPRLLRKSSFLQGHIGDQVASSALTIEACPRSALFATQRFWTSDGYLAGNETIFEKGVLRTYLVDDYGARKLNLTRSLSGGSHVCVQPGETPLQQQISSIKHGLLVGRLSAGAASEAGDFSGVAKNSYAIRDGQIQFPVSETMIAGNYADLLQNIQSLSRETLHLGTAQLPWLHISGCVIS